MNLKLSFELMCFLHKVYKMNA